MLLTIGASCQTTFGQNQVVLSSNGKSSYKILVSDNSDLIVDNAAKQLANYLQKVTTANFHIEKVAKGRASYNGKRFIFVGTAKELETFESDKPTKYSISGESVSINIEQGGNIYLSGGSSRSTLYAVFQFLEDNIGCKWWTPKEESIPRKVNLTIPSGMVNYTPPFYYRSHFINNTTKDAKFATILRENGYNQPLNGIWGSTIDVVGWAHTFKQLIPVDSYFRNHPEWFSDSKNGDRPSTLTSSPPSANNYQLCLENKDLFNEFLKNTLKWIKTVKSKRPDVNIFSISVNDNNKFCRCDESLERIRTEGSPSASLIIFLNKLITEIHKTYPDVKIQTLAYQKFFSAPKSIRPHKDIIVMIAPLNMIVSKSLSDDVNREINNQIKKWGDISSQNFYWGYNTNFNNFFMPFSGINHLKADFKSLEINNIKGVFLQDNNYTNGVGFFLDMQTWVIGKLMWNPNLDPEKLTKEFFVNYYGKSAEDLYKYYLLLINTFSKSTLVNTSFSHDFSYINPSLLQQATERFNSALRASRNNKVIYDRVIKEKFVLDNMKLSSFQLTSKASNSSKINDFTNELKKAGVKKLGIDQSLETLIDGGSKRLSSLSGLEVLSGGNTVLIQQGQFSLDKKGVLTNIIEDKKASDGLSAIIEGKAKGWSIQIQAGKYSNYIIPTDTYQVNIALKADKNSSDALSGNIEVGLYNTVSKKEKAKRLIKVSDISKNTYSRVVAFQNKIEATDIIYISLKQAEVVRLYVDNIEISKK